MKCPRCKLALRTVDYEGIEADMCDACLGFWLDSGELELVLERRKLAFSAEERDKILDVRTASRAGEMSPAACPRCGKTMARAHYDESVHLVIDRCPSHGIWLDTGEIKKVQALAEKSAQIHRLLLRKLAVRPRAEAPAKGARGKAGAAKATAAKMVQKVSKGVASR
jgi:Zn-finger nucleic acid-binding protein